MGRQFLHTVILLGALLLGGACTENPAELPGKPGEGAVAFSLAMPKSRATTADESQYPWNRCAIRVYKYVTDETGQRSRELIRRYNAPTEMPASLWLLAGEYAIAVEAGSKAEATFDEPTYRGEQDFKIVEGATTSVRVNCRLVNTIVKVIYDRTIAATFKESFRTTVAAGDTYDQKRVDKGEVPHLVYEETKKGYFILPADAPAFCWQFEGRGEKNGEPLELTKTGSKTATAEEGVCYELRLKYSPDRGGALEFTLLLDETVDEIYDPIIFRPNPQIAGDGFDIDEVQPYLTGKIAYRISSIADMQEIQVGIGEETFAIPATADYPEDTNGITLEVENPTALRLLLGERFMNRLSGGDHTLTLTAIDKDGGEGTKKTTVRTQGALPVPADPWFNDRKWRGCVLQEASEVKMEYRRQGDADWQSIALTPDGNQIYAAASPAEFGSAYEYRLSVDGTTIGAAQTATYPQAPEAYHAGFEVWSGDTPLLPYTSDADQWWDTGNHGSANASINITTYENTSRPGSAGTTSAKLASQKASVLGIGKFAAGNIFVGKYLGTNIPNGVIGFGKPFPFTYRPKALRFWYKGTVGTVDNAGGSVSNGDADVAQVYICLCKMDGPHVVDTRYSDTFLNFAANSKTMAYCTALNGKNSKNDRTDGHIIAWGEWTNRESVAEWTAMTVDLHYNEEYEGEVPTYLLLTASASKYGDYFAGSTGSVMYLDDVELLY